MTTEIIEVVQPEKYGIEPTKANELMGNLPQIQQERKALEEQYAEIVQMDVENPETAKKARALRLLVKDNRTKGITVWHKTTKEVFLRFTQFIDAVKRREESVNERMEEKLEQIEKHAEIMESKRRDELKNTRLTELAPFAEFVPMGIDLGALSPEEYGKVLNGAKLQLQAKQKAEAEAEEMRKEEERRAKVFQERRVEMAAFTQFIQEGEELSIDTTDGAYASFLQVLKERKALWDTEQDKLRAESERLRKEAEEREAQMNKEREEAEAKLRTERQKADAERRLVEAEEAEKRRVIEEELQREKERAEAERKRLEDQLAAKKADEEKAERDRLAAIEAEANKGDADKVKDLIADLEAITTKYTFKSKKNQSMYSDVRGLIGKVITHIQK